MSRDSRDLVLSGVPKQWRVTPSRPLPVASRQHRGSALTDAERARKHRRREREGVQHLGIDVPHAIIELMIAEKYLTEAEAADRQATGKALETFLADQIGER